MAALWLIPIFLTCMLAFLAVNQLLNGVRRKTQQQARMIARTTDDPWKSPTGDDPWKSPKGDDPRESPWGAEGAPLPEEEKPLPFRERIIRPLLERIGHLLLGLTPRGIREWMTLRMVRAGHPLSLTSFAALRVLVLALGIPLIPFLLGKPLMIPLILLILLLLPELWLSRKISRREQAFIKALPDVMDLLSVSAEAGLSFEGSMTRVARKFPQPIGPEFSSVLRDMRLGQTRSEALAGLTLRVNIPDLRTFVAAVVQGDEMGVGISRILKIQSDYLRKKRWQRAQEKITKLPVKMLIPMVVFIFPALLLVLLGPILLSFLTSF